jgi:hypothetical protein
MCKPSTYLKVAYFPTYLPIWDLFLTELVTMMKQNINSVELRPQLSNNGHPVNGALVGAGSLWAPSSVHSQTVWTSVKKLFLLPKRSSNIQRQTVSSFNISQPMSFGCWPRKCHMLLNYFGSCNSLVAWVRSFLEFATRWKEVNKNRARLNQPPWLHQLAVLSIGWAGWFASFSFTSLPYVNQHSTTVNLFWLLTFHHFFSLPFFSQPWPPYYPPT